MLLGGTACGGESGPTAPEESTPSAARLVVATTDTLIFEAGGRSPEPFRARVTVDGLPLEGVRVAFSTNPGLGRLSQPEAVTDSAGWAESWLLDTRPGRGSVTARLGDESATTPVRILRAPGSIEFLPGTGAAGLPGLPHPDSLLVARVLDTEGIPLQGQEVLFAWSGLVRIGRDTTDADGLARGRLGASRTAAGENPAFALLPGRPGLVAVQNRPTSPVARRVVLVSTGGLRADAVDRWNAPVLRELRTRGAHGIARSVVPSFSIPAHLSLFAGVPPARHGIFADVLEFTPEMNRLDPLFRVGLREGLGTAAVVGDRGHLAPFDEILECRLAFGFDPLTMVEGGAATVVDVGLDFLSDTAVALLFLHLPDPDLAGHSSGWSSEAYGAAVREADHALGRLVEALPDDALLAVVSTHGGGGAFGDFQHGSSAPEDLEVPLFLLGPGVRPGARFETPSILDLAPTLGWALGWAPPSSQEGTILLDAFRDPDRASPASSTHGTRPRGSGPF